jgi:phosphate transport system protein
MFLVDLANPPPHHISLRANTMNRFFHKELEEIRSKIILIGEKANAAGRLAVEAFIESDLEKAQAAIEVDDEIDALEVEIDRASVRYITLRSPVSSDVRLIFVAIKASHDLERAGDEAHSIAKRTRNILTRDGKVAKPVAIEEMSLLAFDMMRDAITSFLDENLELAQGIIERDKKVDKLNKQNFKELYKEMNGSKGEASTQVETILISKSIERIADHAKNLAEEVIYLLTGE